MSEAFALTSPVMLLAPNKAHTQSFLTEDFCVLSLFSGQAVTTGTQSLEGTLANHKRVCRALFTSSYK